MGMMLGQITLLPLETQSHCYLSSKGLTSHFCVSHGVLTRLSETEQTGLFSARRLSDDLAVRGWGHLAPTSRMPNTVRLQTSGCDHSIINMNES
jgi:hypothetical protein